MITWILQQAGYQPGFLIGGNPCNFNASAHYSDSNFFVIEADEYDTAFFDRRSKFIQYNPRTLIINNLEFDHADIFSNLDEIKKQFKHLLRILPSNGLIIFPSFDANVQSLLTDGVFTPQETFGNIGDEWYANKIKADGSVFEVYLKQIKVGEVSWNLIGEHNIQNALAAFAAARHIGITPEIAIKALTTFLGVKRRLELRGRAKDICVYDDFAHHPTAIATTLAGLRNRVGKDRIFAVLEFASNTMRAGHHELTISDAFKDADNVVLLRPNTSWEIEKLLSRFKQPVSIYDNVQDIVNHLVQQCHSGDHIVCMSNHHFDNIYEKLLDKLASQ